MKMLFSSAEKHGVASTLVPMTKASGHLLQRFIETGDERCPLAGLWTLVTLDEPTDDSERTRPVMGFLILWRAFITA